MKNEKVNKTYSPLSIKYALAMLNDGVKGETRKQIESIIGDYEANQYTNSSNLSLANAIFIKNDFKDNINSDYLDTLKKNYNAEVVYDDFATPDKVNSWVSEKTLKLINNLVSDISNYNFILINALAINMDWDEKFLEHQGMTVNYDHENFVGSVQRAYLDINLIIKIWLLVLYMNQYCGVMMLIIMNGIYINKIKIYKNYRVSIYSFISMLYFSIHKSN